MNAQLLWWRGPNDNSYEIQQKKRRTGKERRRRLRKKRSILFDLQNGKCFWCNKLCTRYSWTIEHLVSAKYGGTNDIKNLAMACYDCNQKRGAAKLLAIIKVCEKCLTQKT